MYKVCNGDETTAQPVLINFPLKYRVLKRHLTRTKESTHLKRNAFPIDRDPRA